MKILVLNWRDIKNPDAGGAEVLTHEMAKRWVRAGHMVTQISAEFPKAPKEELVEGVRIIRSGSSIIRDPHVPVHIAAYRWYKRYGQGKFDVVLDEIHGIPFFTPLYVKEKKVALICEVADELWNVTFPFPLNAIGRTIEHHYFHFYRRVPFLTISPSTKKDLTTKGISAHSIMVLPMGLTIPTKFKGYEKEKNPTLIFVGRMSKTKGINDILEVLHLIKSEIPQIKLWVVGPGDDTYVRQLREKIRLLRLQEHVRFFGYVSQDKKFELMARAHILLAASVKEGWGLIVPEAGFMGTPSVVYNVEGLRDIITNGENGLLTATNPIVMGKAVKKLLTDPALYSKIQTGAQIRAKTFDWDKTAALALSVLES